VLELSVALELPLLGLSMAKAQTPCDKIPVLDEARQSYPSIKVMMMV
jgi:hypothetical protein